MDFDFDDLEEAAPSGVLSDLAGRLLACAEQRRSMAADVKAMTNSQARGFGSRLRGAVELRKFGDLATAFAEAVWTEEEIAARMPRIVKEFMGLLDDLASQKVPDIQGGAAVIFSLWQISLSTSMHEVRVRPGAGAGAPCALVLGFGGSGVDDLEGQADFYGSRGFTVVSTTKVSCPEALSYKQDAAIARELGKALGGGGGLVLHMCSHYGVSYGYEVMLAWNAGVAPFGELPPLAECVKGMVFDCSPAAALDPATKAVVLPSSAEDTEACMRQHLASTAQRPTESQTPAGDGPENDSEMDKSETQFYKTVIVGCIGALAKKWGATSLADLYTQNASVGKCLQAAARATRKPFPWAPAPGPVTDPLLFFQVLDWSLEPPVPRLFLYSRLDAVVPQDRVEAYIKHVARYRPDAEVLQALVRKSEHCRLWTAEREACAAAVSELLQKAGLSPGLQPAMGA